MNARFRSVATLVLAALLASIGCSSPAPQSKAAETCPIHRTRLLADEVTIFHGIMDTIPPNLGGNSSSGAAQESETDALRTRFPLHRMHVYKGCVNTDPGRKTEPVRYCSDCRVARHAWYKERYGWDDAKVAEWLAGH